jgi:hypothetical protein
VSVELDAVWDVLHAPRKRVKNWKRPNYNVIFQQRSDRLDTIRAAGQGGWELAFEYYKTHPIEAIEDWVTTYDPRKTSDGEAPYMPFTMFDKQREFVEWIIERYHNKEEGLLEKSRDGGASWVCLAIAWWMWTFHSGTVVLFGSRKEDLVDELGNPDSLFEKLRIILRMLPDELLPIGYDERKHDNHMRLSNPENGSAIVGEAGNQVGRGGRSSIAFIDEAAFLEKPEKVDSALSENTNTRIWVSTPNLPGDWWSKRRFGGRVLVFTLAWQDDPRKGPKWYARKKASLEPEVLAREVDLDYEGTGSNIICPASWVRSSVQLHKYLKNAGLLPEPHAGVAGLDVGGGGTGLSVLVPKWGAVMGRSIEWDDDDTINIAGAAEEAARKLKCDMILYDSVGVGKGVLAAFRRMDFVTKGINVGTKPTRKKWPDGKNSRKKFTNLKGELWWTMRSLLEAAHQYWMFISTNGKSGQLHKLEDMILLPDDHKLTSQLSQPLYIRLETGKMQVEAKKKLKSRGVDSPDHAEAAILALAPPPRRGGSDRTTGMV